MAQSVATYHPPSQRPNAFALHRPSQMNITDVHSLSSSINESAEKQQEVGQTPVGITEPNDISQQQQQQATPQTKNSYLKRN